jgi:hypothetical protein
MSGAPNRKSFRVNVARFTACMERLSISVVAPAWPSFVDLLEEAQAHHDALVRFPRPYTTHTNRDVQEHHH